MVTDFSTFWERENGKMDLDALYPSWLIFSDGFVGGWVQALSKRIFDIVASVLLLLFSTPIMLFAALAIKLESRGPVFYLQERVGLNGKALSLTAAFQRFQLRRFFPNTKNQSAALKCPQIGKTQMEPAQSQNPEDAATNGNCQSTAPDCKFGIYVEKQREADETKEETK